MSRYLLLQVLVLGVVDSQLTNVTEEESGRVARNQTFSPFWSFNTTEHSVNATSSWYKDPMSEIEDERHNNQTSVITEDDESFQDQVMVQHCNTTLLVLYAHNPCLLQFDLDMMSIAEEDWCDLESVIRPYNSLTLCLEILSTNLRCYYPNPTTQDVFLEVHSYYFHSCSQELGDAPHSVVMALTIVPVTFIPVLVYLVARPPRKNNK